MVNQSTPSTPAVGACLRCNQLFLVTDSSSACLVCGRAADVSLPFGQFVPAGEDVALVPPTPAEAPPSYYSAVVTCPHCDNHVELHITDSEIVVVPPPSAPPAEEAAPEVLPNSEAAPSPAATETAPTQESLGQ